jgi:beta-lactamase regulating signal transducer with metallopeptidase domain
MNAKVQEICVHLFPATLNGVYQGIILSVIVAAILGLWVRTNAATRHAIWFATLMLVVLIIPAHYWLDKPTPSGTAGGTASAAGWTSELSPDAPVESSSTVAWLDPLGDMPEAASGMQPETITATSMGSGQVADLRISRAPLSSHDSGGLQVPFTWSRVSGLLKLVPQISRALFSAAAYEVLKPVHWRVESATAVPLVGGVFALWLGLAGSQLLLLSLKVRRLLRMRGETFPPEPALLMLFNKLKERSNVCRPVELRISSEGRCPMVIGFLRPMVLLPRNVVSQVNLMELQQVLRHELAHVARYDDWANLIQHVVKAILFFHPSVWWINGKLSLEREIACDDEVLQQCGRRQEYALTLANVASRLRQRTPMLAPGVSNSNSQLQQRIHMILNTHRNASPRLAKGRTTMIISAAALLALLAANSGPRFVLSAEPVATASPAISVQTSTVNATPSPAISVAESVNIESSAVSQVAQADAPAVVTVQVDSGPKFKPEPAAGEPGEPGEPAAVIAADPPDAPSIETTPRPPATPRAARLGKPGKVRAQDAGDVEKDGDSSIEERLRRVEKMVRALMEQQGNKRAHGEFYFKDGAEHNFNLDQQQMDKIRQSTERQAARAAEQAQRAAEQANRATRDLEARVDQGQGNSHETFERHIEALRKAREGLSQEMEKLNRQIEKLEKEQQRSEKDRQRRSEAPSEKLQAQFPKVAPVGN